MLVLAAAWLATAFAASPTAHLAALALLTMSLVLAVKLIYVGSVKARYRSDDPKFTRDLHGKTVLLLADVLAGTALEIASSLSHEGVQLVIGLPRVDATAQQLVYLLRHSANNPRIFCEQANLYSPTSACRFARDWAQKSAAGGGLAGVFGESELRLDALVFCYALESRSRTVSIQKLFDIDSFALTHMLSPLLVIRTLLPALSQRQRSSDSGGTAPTPVRLVVLSPGQPRCCWSLSEALRGCSYETAVRGFFDCLDAMTPRTPLRLDASMPFLQPLPLWRNGTTAAVVYLLGGPGRWFFDTRVVAGGAAVVASLKRRNVQRPDGRLAALTKDEFNDIWSKTDKILASFA